MANDNNDNQNKITLVFIINGENVPVEANVNAPLLPAVQHALRESHNTGRNPDEWQVRDANGALLEMHRTPKELRLGYDTKLFLSLAVGAGGAAALR